MTMSDERWEILRKITLATKSWYWTHDECVEVAAEMDRLRAENAALKVRLAEAEGLLADIITPNDCRAPNATPVTEVDIVDFLTRDVEPDTKPTAEGGE